MFIEKWKKKKLFDKITDILFVVLLIGLLIPQSRTAIIVTVKRVIAFSPKAISTEERETVERDDFYWKMESLDGQQFNLSDFRGKVLFINEWATWCPPCIAEMPSIQKLYDRLKNDDEVVFVIVTNEKKSVVQTFIDENDYTFPVLLARSETPGPFFSPSIPTTFIVSPEGEIVSKEVGSKKWHGEDTVRMIRSLYGG
ncbi:MAG: TlpA family protein disulfide reductase [Spirochaetaceae bacterium]|nr:TlpA family protein disulfide reductase [Spirochaetaceae bacterium]